MTKTPSDQEEDNDDDPFLADFFQGKDPKTNRHKWLVCYYCNLFSPDSGFHKNKNRLQHASQVRRIMEETDPSGDDITFMAEDRLDRLGCAESESQETRHSKIISHQPGNFS